VNITILGAGAWGTALGVALSERHTVTLWARDPAQRAELAGDRRSRYWRGIIKVSEQLQELINKNATVGWGRQAPAQSVCRCVPGFL